MSLRMPYIDVHIPKTVHRGDLMVICARFLDSNTLKPIKVSEVFLQIISTNDHEYWKTSLMKQDVYALHIAVSTLEMKDEDYVVKVSDHKEMLSFGFNRVRVKKSKRLFQNMPYRYQIQC